MAGHTHTQLCHVKSRTLGHAPYLPILTGLHELDVRKELRTSAVEPRSIKDTLNRDTSLYRIYVLYLCPIPTSTCSVQFPFTHSIPIPTQTPLLSSHSYAPNSMPIPISTYTIYPAVIPIPTPLTLFLALVSTRLVRSRYRMIPRWARGMARCSGRSPSCDCSR